MSRTSRLALLLFILTVALTTTAPALAHRLSGHPKTLKGQLALAKAQVRHDRASGDRHWLARDRRYVRELAAAIRRASTPRIGPHWLVNAFMCIHRFEGSWQDPNDPYWGGLQMDRSFMQRHGSDMIRRYGGWANVWPPAAQIAVAIRAYHSRGFGPWPNTSRMCGLR